MWNFIKLCIFESLSESEDDEGAYSDEDDVGIDDDEDMEDIDEYGPDLYKDEDDRRRLELKRKYSTTYLTIHVW